MENEQNVAPGEGLIYGLNDRPPLKETIFAALQRLVLTSRLQVFLFPWRFSLQESLLSYSAGG